MDAIRDTQPDLSPQVALLRHPARGLLDTLRTTGARAQSTQLPWSHTQLQMALARGPHKSAKENVAFLREEFADMIRKGHWTLLPAEDVIDLPTL